MTRPRNDTLLVCLCEESPTKQSPDYAQKAPELRSGLLRPRRLVLAMTMLMQGIASTVFGKTVS